MHKDTWSVFSMCGSRFGEPAPTLSKLYFGGEILCNIIFMHYVLKIIYQLYRVDNTSILTFETLTLKA